MCFERPTLEQPRPQQQGCMVGLVRKLISLRLILLTGQTYYTSYSASKFAVRGIVQCSCEFPCESCIVDIDIYGP